MNEKSKPVKRELKDYAWIYFPEEQQVQIANKKDVDEVGDPTFVNIGIFQVDSLIRALLAFKNQYRRDMLRKARHGRK